MNPTNRKKVMIDDKEYIVIVNYDRVCRHVNMSRAMAKCVGYSHSVWDIDVLVKKVLRHGTITHHVEGDTVIKIGDISIPVQIKREELV